MPMKAENLIAMLATETGIDVKDVSLHARRLREAGLFVKETRSPNSPRVRPRQVANLLIMLMAEQPAAYAQKVIGMAENLEADFEFLKQNAKNLSRRSDEIASFGQEHSFVDALETLIKMAIARPSDFETSNRGVARFEYLKVTFDRQNMVADIHFEIGYSIEHPLSDPNLNEIFGIDYYDLRNDPGKGASKSFLQQNTIEAELFAAIGRCFAKGAVDDAE